MVGDSSTINPIRTLYIDASVLPILYRFVLMVRRGYRDPPYHNWAHAFAVAHFCFLLYKNAALNTYIE